MKQPLPSKSTFTAIIADDHSIVRQGIERTLMSLDDLSTIIHADNGLKAIALTKKHKPDLIVLDSAMPMARGIEVYFEARRWSPESSIVLFTGFTSASLLSDWLDAGIDGVLLKSCGSAEIALGLKTVLNGGRYVAEQVLAILEENRGSMSLSPREREVLSLIASGNSNLEIASRLSISQKTVEKHRASLMKKLDVHSVAELMVYALREGLLDDYQ